MNRVITLATISALLFLVTGCPDTSPPMPSVDTPDNLSDIVDGDGVVPPDDAEVLDDADGLPDGSDSDQTEPDADAPPPPAELTFCLMTPVAGCMGEESEQIDLEDIDDLYPATPEFEVDVQVTTLNVPPGTTLSLIVDGNTVAEQVLPGDVLSFAMVQLSHAVEPDCHQIEVDAEGLISAVKTVCVNTGSCGVNLVPTNQECLTEDSEPDAEGFQVTFTVTSGGTDCDQAWLETDAGAMEPVALVDGGVDITLTLAETADELDCEVVTITAYVGDSTDDTRTESLELDYTLDTVPPTLEITTPIEGTLNLGDDLDGNPDNGIQFSLDGLATGLGPDDEISVTIDGEEVAITTSLGGAFSVNPITLDTDGLHEIAVAAADACCAQAATDSVEIVALLAPANVMILSPLTEATLLAADDEAPETAAVMDTGFLLYAPLSVEGTTLEIQCRKDQPGSLWQTPGMTTIAAVDPDGQYGVDVQLDVELLGNEVVCRAKDDGVPPETSPEISLTVGLPAPLLIITAPEDGEIVPREAFSVVGATQFLDGQTVTLALTQNDIEAWTADLTATDLGVEVLEDLSMLVEGMYTLTATATDLFGNDAAATEGSLTTISVELDGVAPGLTLVAPLDNAVCDVQACPDVDPDLLGHQIAVQALVADEAHPELTEVCLSFNGGSNECLFADAVTGDALFGGLTVAPEINTIDLVATDAAGHETMLPQASFTFDVDAPKVTITNPPGDKVVAAQPVPVTVTVTAPDGATPLTDASVTLWVDGAEFETSDAGPGGLYSFSLDGLIPDVAAEIQASATHPDHVEIGYSGERSVLLKEGTPVIAITVPQDGAVLNLASDVCSAGIPGCSLAVTAITTNVEDGSSATLSVDCGAPAETEEMVQGDAAVWAGVQLDDNTTCTLTASVEDLAGQTADSDPVVVTVDRTAPVLMGFQQPDFELMPAGLDEDLGTEGYQFTIIVGLQGLEAGQSVDLQITPEIGAPDVVSVILDEAIPDGVTEEVIFPQYTFEAGVNQLLVSVADIAGNGDSIIYTVQIFLDTAQVSMEGSDYVPFDDCFEDGECSAAGICAPLEGGNKCVFPLNAGAHKVDVETTPADLFSTEASPLRLCSAHPGLLAQGASLCETQDGPVSFREIKSVDHGGGNAFVQLTAADIGALPEGYHRVVAEALTDTGEWIHSADTPNYAQQERQYWLDLVAPEVTGLVFPSDTQPPLGTLSLVEVDAAPSTFLAEISVSIEETGDLEVWDNGILIAEAEFISTDTTLMLDLFEGLNALQILAYDNVGNVSAPWEIDVFVDTTVPVLSFTAPASSPLIVGSSADATLVASGTDGNDVHLERKLGDTWVELSAGPPDGLGLVSFSDVLSQDGDYQLRGWVRDDANNEAQATTSPEIISVDRTAPIATLNLPAAEETFGDDDDASLTTPGFQFVTDFDVAGATIWTIRMAECPDATFTGCGTGSVAETGVLPDESLATINQMITVGAVDEATEYRQVQVEVTDGVGNSLTLGANLTLTFSACQVSFTDAPESGWYNTAYCNPPGADCGTITPDLTATFATGCGAVEEVRLYKNGAAESTLPVAVGNSVPFTLNLADGENVDYEARLLIGGAETGDTTGIWTYDVDLTLPVVAFTAPAPSTASLAQADDLNPGAPGCQISAGVNVTGDNLSGGDLVLTSATGGPDTVLGEQTMTAAPFAYTWPSSVTLEESSALSLTATATDAAGNAGAATLTLVVDVTPPGAVDLDVIDSDTDINPRRPAVTLSWTAVGDDGAGGDAATSYEVRYSASPISPANYDQSCDLSSLSQTAELPPPATPGINEIYTITGPDDRAPGDPCRFVTGVEPGSTWYFAVKAYDDVGNASDFATENAESTDALSLSYTQLDRGSYTDGNMDSHPVPAGDINNDGRGDLLLGAWGENGFCLMRGRDDPPATVDISQDALTQCLFDGVVSNVGLDLAGLGDVNGDGYDDVAVVSYKDGDGTDRTRVRVYLGSETGVLETTPDVTFVFGTTDLFWVNFVPIAGAGNFNGDLSAGKPVDDIVIATPQTNTAYVIPGNPNWGLATLEVDLEDAVDRAAANVLEITMPGAGASDWFGMSAAGVGNALVDGDGGGTQYDDIVISMYTGPSAAYVISGRALSGATAITLSAELDGSGSEDTAAVRLRPQGSDINKDWFFGQILGGEDLDCDGVPEIIGAHLQAALSNGRSIYVFHSDFIATGIGETLYIGAIQPAGSAFISPNGTIIKGNYQAIGLLGNFDDSPIQPECSGDLVYGDFNGMSYFGSVYIRYNLPGVHGMGSFQEVDLLVGDPYDPGNLDFGGLRLAPVGDFTGDGRPDLVVGTKGSGYMVLIR